MKSAGQILIVDDDPMFRDLYRDVLRRDGYAVDTAASQEQALARLDERDWAVVILDLKLPESDEGIELIGEVRARSPGAKAIIVTAYTSGDAIERAYAAGAYDFLEKQSKFFEHHLRAKVRNAIEAVREHELGRMGDSEAEARIAERWQALQNEQDANRKGLLLEELMELVFRSVEGFRVFPPRRRSEDEEIDLVIQIDSGDLLWARESPYILVECKNWSRRAGPDAFDRFRSKIKRRYGRATLGLFVAPGGFTEGFHTTRSAERKGKILVVCIGPDELAALVAASDRNAELKKLHARAIIEANGSH